MDPGLIFTGIEGCIKLGAILRDACKTWKAAEVEVDEKIVRIELTWVKTEFQIIAVQDIAMALEQEHRRILENVMMLLATKLSVAVTEMQKLTPRERGQEPRVGFWSFGQRVDRWQYVRMKTTLNAIIHDLEAWQQRFDPSWLLLIRVNNPVVDDALQRGSEAESRGAVSQPAAALASAGGRGDPPFRSSPLASAKRLRAALRASPEQQRGLTMARSRLEVRPIPYSSALMARPPIDQAEWYIVDPIPLAADSDIASTHADVRRLAHKLRQADPTAFGLLTCKGVMPLKDSHSGRLASLDLVFYQPRDIGELQSLRQALLAGHNPTQACGAVSLNRRVSIARELVKSISYVHTFDFVHKNVRPESILFYEDAGSRQCSTFLVGFEGFRRVNGASAMLGDGLWYRNIYRHPSRQGEYPAEYYRMEHDIYSLGVCLLEVGLWESFVQYDESQCPKPGPGIEGIVQSWRVQNGRDSNMPGDECMYHMIALALDRLPTVMGEIYTGIVVSCLTCLEEANNMRDGDLQTQDTEGILAGVRFIENILLQVNEIKI
ncbi:hypothetical protein PG985_011899 [Apiospora marii]|uniref:uncharacterized protein n=1 Tax=Apiospora marii TaxID=335849 RepID=UPI003130BB18